MCPSTRNHFIKVSYVVSKTIPLYAGLMLLRTMSPQLIVTDEISTKTDAEAIQQCFGTGVSVVASAHGDSAQEIMSRESLRPLFGGIGVRQIIVLHKEGMGINTKIFGKVTEIKA